MTNRNKAKWQSWVNLLRSWGFTVKEMPNCYSANNGLDWFNGQGPEASLCHHFVCGTNNSQNYIDGLVSMLVKGYSTPVGFLPGPVVNRFVDVNGVIYLIATGPANHAGQGSSIVLTEAKRGIAPVGSAASRGLQDDGVKNYRYVGTETQHPGNSTPYSPKLIDALVALNAADCITWGYGPEAVIQHFEATARKTDMSYAGGIHGNPGPGKTIRDAVARLITEKSGKPVPVPAPKPQPAPAPAPAPKPVHGSNPIYGMRVPNIIAKGSGRYLGDIDGSNISLGGINSTERYFIRKWQQFLIWAGFVPGVHDINSSWADGTFNLKNDGRLDGPSTTSTIRYQRKYRPNNTSIWGKVYWDDWETASKIREP